MATGFPVVGAIERAKRFGMKVRAPRSEVTGRSYLIEMCRDVACRARACLRKNRPTRRQSQRRDLSRLVLTHESRQLPSWLIFDVRQSRDDDCPQTPSSAVGIVLMDRGRFARSIASGEDEAARQGIRASDSCCRLVDFRWKDLRLYRRQATAQSVSVEDDHARARRLHCEGRTKRLQSRERGFCRSSEHESEHSHGYLLCEVAARCVNPEMPNKAPEPTVRAVTPPAAQEPRQP